MSRHLWASLYLVGPRIADLFRADIPLSEAASLLSDAIDRAGLNHAELEGQRQDYRYVIVTLKGDPYWSGWNPHKDHIDLMIDGHGYTKEFLITPTELRAGIATYLDALRAWNRD